MLTSSTDLNQTAHNLFVISEEIYLTTVDQVLGFKVVSKFEPPRPSGQRLLKVLAAKSMAEHFGQHSCTA